MSGGMAELRDSGIMIQLAHQAMLKMGLDVSEVCKRLGITPELLTDRNLRTPHEAQGLFWSVMEEVSQDPNIGLHLGENMPVYKGQVLQYLFLSSPTFGDGLARAFNYQRLLSDASQASVEVHDGLACIVVDSVSELLGSLRHLNECMVLGLIGFFRYVTDGAFRPSAIDFSHSAPTDTSEYERIFGCPVRFSEPETRIHFDIQLLDLPSLHAEPELLQLHEKLASEHVAKLERQDVVTRVYKVFGEVLETGQVNLEDVASRLNIKSRTLRTRLAEAGTNFNQLLADYRCNLAKKLLSGTDESIDEIVYLTGFSEPSTFYRAFKRWTNQTPVEYRNSRR
ncbi:MULTISPECIES: AraC family transcriptional regulator [Thalassolituus]|jgi:AraC-like DNA-binding protein|uniref:AraC family transcriptional regulator n=3 Tax=root TaxID=1 RepID=M5DR10_9GAMM|nr:AraC family transcriptional regulator [Thalassolituus oleivorans]AHK16308.1 transcriptional regulator [Thalassolituus oleivorans R6-15]MDF1639991.1 AraC family transcriptional regulator [Thalassolituus oleivorans]CCU71557.1 AraC family transcriptional regulator [Thalassolituus oleivorans MIL-1]|tara:strand:+ start:171 stop:1187 length:1017 start_codon:yes stop_codon:yes gene_type:complete